MGHARQVRFYGRGQRGARRTLRGSASRSIIAIGCVYLEDDMSQEELRLEAMKLTLSYHSGLSPERVIEIANMYYDYLVVAKLPPRSVA